MRVERNDHGNWQREGNKIGEQKRRIRGLGWEDQGVEKEI